MDGEADLSEEVIRILGYDNVHSILPTSELDLDRLKRKAEQPERHPPLSPESKDSMNS
jgi:phenylalanyl-tRNA synthetase beta subunit